VKTQQTNKQKTNGGLPCTLGHPNPKSVHVRTYSETLKHPQGIAGYATYDRHAPLINGLRGRTLLCGITF
jgi:hypothetical protein